MSLDLLVELVAGGTLLALVYCVIWQLPTAYDDPFRPLGTVRWWMALEVCCAAAVAPGCLTLLAARRRV